MNAFEELRKDFLELTMVDGEYKTGKLNSKAGKIMKARIEAFEIPGCPTRVEKIDAIRSGFSEMTFCTCGKQLHMIGPFRMAKYCSSKCSANSDNTKELRKGTNLEKYGTEYSIQSDKVKEKMFATNLEKYGSKASWANSEVREKMKKTNLELYGVENPAKAPEIIAKIKETQFLRSDEQKEETKRKAIETNMEKYGVAHAQLTQKAREAQSKRLIGLHAKIGLDPYFAKLKESSNVIPAFTKEDWEGYIRSYTWKHVDCDKEFKATAWSARSMINCPFCRKKSKVQKLVEDVVYSTGLDVIVEDRKEIYPYEIDIFVPEKRVGIEVNGMYWHHTATASQPLLFKTEKFNGHLLHFWDYEIQSKPAVVTQLIWTALDIFPELEAYEVQKISIEVANEFFKETTFSREVAGEVETLGLFKGESLTSVVAFKPVEGEWEIVSFASKDISTKEGFSAILREFSRDKYGQVLSVTADRRFYNDSFFLENGFKKNGIIQPSYFYFCGEQVVHPGQLLDELLTEARNSPIGEEEYLKENKWYKCFDCGQAKYRKLI